LLRFEDGTALVSYFNAGRCAALALDEKDRLAGALVRAASDPLTAELAIELLLLGLWPGLTAVFGRLLRLFDGRPGELASALVSDFTVCVRRLDLAGCSRVASTLVWNTERVVLAGWKAEKKVAACTEELSGETDSIADPSADRAVALADLRILLSGIVPRDVDLVLSVVVRGRNCHQAGAELGMTHERARKRFTRAVAKIRERLRESGVPDRGGPSAFLGR